MLDEKKRGNLGCEDEKERIKGKQARKMSSFVLLQGEGGSAGPPGPAGPMVSHSFVVQIPAEMQEVAGLEELLPCGSQEWDRATMGRLGCALVSQCHPLR